ncbi:MAG TPA: hypothetical protein DEA26_04100 [Oceanospirillales bacterium]|nr:hypothetical protein [Oceanospirillales bacterium]|tara:strand:- start:246 stop:1721 length:1476 start_codon:yes stop_codon:yes gene_type:complete
MSGILKVLAALLVAAFITFLLFFSEKGEHAEPVVIPESLTELPSPVTGKPFVSEALAESIITSPCSASISYLLSHYALDSRTYDAMAAIDNGFAMPPAEYGAGNPWSGNITTDGLILQMAHFFTDWCTFLPEISGDQDNGLKYIQEFAWFYYRNYAAQSFVQGFMPGGNRPLQTGLVFTRMFSEERGAFMNSPASAANVSQWVSDPRIEISDYEEVDGGGYDYATWNDFFSRQIKIDTVTETIPSRPVTMPERDYVVSAPTDCIMNPLLQVLGSKPGAKRKFIDNPLAADTVLDVKTVPINVMDLLGNAPAEIKDTFVGGTGLSCVLMPNTYHHFHAPVSGEVVHAEIIESGTFGYIDWPNWVPADGNVGQAGTDFSQFNAFQRGVVIIKVTYDNMNGEPVTGYVASIPVGLDTIGSVVLDADIKEGATVKRGYTRLGNFFYGGSLDILLFSKGLATGAVQTRLGNQIAVLNTGKLPEEETEAETEASEEE